MKETWQTEKEVDSKCDTLQIFHVEIIYLLKK